MTTIAPQCWGCKHLHDRKGWFCDAFPEGIPLSILGWEIEHKKPLSGQKGDIVFEEREEFRDRD